MRFIAVIVVIIFISGCNESLSFKEKSKAEKIAEESREKNPVKKGRYECWKETDSIRLAASPFYILSNSLYQVDDQVGKYQFNAKENTLEFRDGPFGDGLEMTARYIDPTADKKNDSLREPMIEIIEKSRTVLRCSCSLFVY